jgi:hypothetical protein
MLGLLKTLVTEESAFGRFWAAVARSKMFEREHRGIGRRTAFES